MRIFAGLGVLYGLILVVCSVGWVMNLIRLIALAHQDHPNVVMAGARIASVFTFLPAGVIGWIPN